MSDFTQECPSDPITVLMYPGLDLPELADLVGRPAWQSRAACRSLGSAGFVTESEVNARLAKATCARCHVRAECLAYALSHPELEGVWGGTITRERRNIRRRAREGRYRMRMAPEDQGA